MQEEKRKRCFKCGETKPLSCFYKHPEMLDGHVNKCKECNKKDVRKNRTENLEYYKEYDRIRGRDKEAPRQVARRAKNKSTKKLESRKKNVVIIDPEQKYKATRKVSNAIRDGKLKQEKVCFCCGSGNHVHAHHSSYDTEMWLVVTWLCAGCHARLHKDFEYLTGVWRPNVPRCFQ